MKLVKVLLQASFVPALSHTVLFEIWSRLSGVKNRQKAGVMRFRRALHLVTLA